MATISGNLRESNANWPKEVKKRGRGAKSSGMSRVVVFVAVVAGYLGDFIRRKLSTEGWREARALLTGHENYIAEVKCRTRGGEG